MLWGLGHFCYCLLSPSNILALFLFAFVYLLLDFYKKQCTIFKNIPPGPTPWPVIGNLLIPLSSLLRNALPHGSRAIVFDTVEQQANVYGSIYSLFIGGKLIVVLSSFELVKDAFLNHPDVFSDRPDIPIVNLLIEKKGIVLAPYGPVWRKQRRFCHMSLRNFGLGKLSLEPSIQQILSNVKTELLQLSEECGSAGVDLHPLISNSMSNVICSLTFGQRYRHDDPEFRTIVHLLHRALIITGNSSAIVVNICSLLYYLPFGVFKELRQVNKGIREFFKKIIAEHRSTLDPENPRDLTDMYLIEMMALDAAGEKDSSFTEDELVHVIGDLFFAGTETTTNSVLWVLLYMVLHPDIQDKIRAEIDEHVGKNRTPSKMDRDNLPFTEATIMEVHRLQTVLPFSVPHMTSETIDFRGYTIPKDTIVLPNIWAAHRDPAVWDDPNTFNPRRFLDQDGLLVRKECLIPFGIGRRVCMGEQLAKTELFLTIATLLQAFKFKLPEGQPPPPLLGSMLGLSMRPCPFKVCVTARDR